MKKIIFIIIMISSVLILKAQNTDDLKNTEQDVFKQEAGNSALEVNFDPGQIFGSNTGNQFGLFNGAIKYRYFTSELSAFRANIDLAFNVTTEITQQEDNDNNRLELKDKYSRFGINLQPGYEKHFSANKRLSPYIGAQLLIGYNTSSLKRENQDNNSIYIEKWTNNLNIGLFGTFSVGAGAFAGIDFYFVRKLYMGLEIGYELHYTKTLKSKYTNENNSNADYEEKNDSYFRVAPSLATGNIRLGWTF